VLPIPRRYEAQGLRRYGFHDLSYAYLAGELARLAGQSAAPGWIVMCHLGNSASLAAIRDGEPVETSMALTPAAGGPMSTRSGDLDPGLGWYLARAGGMTPQQFSAMVNFQSGLLGISETSADMRDLLALEAQDPRAVEAIGVFCYQIKRNHRRLRGRGRGLGHGRLSRRHRRERAASQVRARICEGLEFLGIALDEARNAASAEVISSAASPVTVRVLHTDEERMIAQIVRHVLNLEADGRPKP
jgi:acetate kinase